MKRPAGIDGEALNNRFRGVQETNIMNEPAVDISILFNPNPVETNAREELTKKFNEIQIADWIKELTQDYRFEDKKHEFEETKKNFKNIGFQKAKEGIIATIVDALQDAKDLRYIDINGLVMLDPNFVLVGLPHFNPEQEIHIPFNQPVKDFVNDLKRQYYTISYKVKLALLKDGQFIEIDENSEDHITHWLIKNGYSRDETIYILPVDKDYYGPIYERDYWTKGTPSPYTTHFDKFRKQLEGLAYRLCFIGEYTLADTSRFLFPNSRDVSNYLHHTHSNLKTGEHFTIYEYSLLRMHARFLNRLEVEYRAGQFTEREYIKNLNEINNLFDEQYSIYGFKQPNPFYFEGILNTHLIGDILMDYGFIDRNLIGEALYDFVRPFGASRSSLTMEYYKGDANKDTIPRRWAVPWVKLRSGLESAIIDFASKNEEVDDEIAKDAIDKVSEILNGFIQTIEDAHAVRDRFEAKGLFRNNAKIKLLMRIQNCHPALRKIDSIEKLSELLFNNKDYLDDYFISSDVIDSRPAPSTLHRITLNFQRRSINDFDGLISELELEDIKNKVEDIIYSWMFSNPYSMQYVTETLYRFGRLQQKSFLKLEYELMQVLTHAVSVHKDIDTMSFTSTLKELGIARQAMKDLLTSGDKSPRSAKVRDLLRAKTTIVSYILDGSMTEQKLQFYDRALAKIDEYIATRHLRLFEDKIVSKRGYDKKLWKDDKIMAYHVITLLCRDLGFDPLTFQPLNPLIFDADPHTGLFARHHLDNRRKFSVYLQDLLLTDNIQHSYYDSYIPLSDQKIFVQIIQDLIQSDGSGPNKEITAKDVVNKFLSNFGDPNAARYYLESYWQSADFKDNLKIFNERRDIIKSGNYEKFIKNEYNNAYIRFFEDSMNVFDSLSELSDFKGYSLSRVFSIADIYYLKKVFRI